MLIVSIEIGVNIWALINHDYILDDKILDIFIDEMNETVIINKKLTKKLKKLHDNHKKTKKK